MKHIAGSGHHSQHPQQRFRILLQPLGRLEHVVPSVDAAEGEENKWQLDVMFLVAPVLEAIFSPIPDPV
jgi:hypothetical protein